jgi:hypothetical protein
MGEPPLKIVMLYSRFDEDMKNELNTHLANLRNNGTIAIWHDRDILPGKDWKKEIKINIDNADIVLLLISANFLASDFINEHEMKIAINRHRKGESTIIPIALKECDLEGNELLDGFQFLPKDAKPISTWSNKDTGYLDVVKGIRKIINLKQKKESIVIDIPKKIFFNYRILLFILSGILSELASLAFKSLGKDSEIFHVLGYYSYPILLLMPGLLFGIALSFIDKQRIFSRLYKIIIPILTVLIYWLALVIVLEKIKNDSVGFVVAGFVGSTLLTLLIFLGSKKRKLHLYLMIPIFNGIIFGFLSSLLKGDIESNGGIFLWQNAVGISIYFCHNNTNNEFKDFLKHLINWKYTYLISAITILIYINNYKYANDFFFNLFPFLKSDKQLAKEIAYKYFRETLIV